MADPTALQVAVAAAQAVEFVGLPEARINLAQAVIHLALAPKSNAVDQGDRRGRRPTCGAGCIGPVPAHLRDAHYPGAKQARPRQGLPVPARLRATGVVRAAVRARRAGRTAATTSRPRHGAEARFAERWARSGASCAAGEHRRGRHGRAASGRSPSGRPAR